MLISGAFLDADRVSMEEEMATEPRIEIVSHERVHEKGEIAPCLLRHSSGTHRYLAFVIAMNPFSGSFSSRFLLLVICLRVYECQGFQFPNIFGIKKPEVPLKVRIHGIIDSSIPFFDFVLTTSWTFRPTPYQSR